MIAMRAFGIFLPVDQYKVTSTCNLCFLSNIFLSTPWNKIESWSNNKAKPTFLSKFSNYLSVRLLVGNRCLLGIPWFYHKTRPFNICYPISFSKNSWIWIGLSIHFENRIWIVNHICVMYLDWIDNPK